MSWSPQHKPVNFSNLKSPSGLAANAHAPAQPTLSPPARAGVSRIATVFEACIGKRQLKQQKRTEAQRCEADIPVAGDARSGLQARLLRAVQVQLLHVVRRPPLCVLRLSVLPRVHAFGPISSTSKLSVHNPCTKPALRELNGEVLLLLGVR